MIKGSDEKERRQALAEYLRLLFEGPVSKEVFGRYAPYLDTASAEDVNATLDEVLSEASEAGRIDAWKQPVARFIRSASRGLESQELPPYPASSIFARLEDENRGIERALAEVQGRIAEVRAARGGVDSLKKGLRGLSILRQHYEDLQNELFPLFERYSPRHACVRLMWSIEDDVLGLLDSLIAADPSEGQDFWNRLGAFYLAAASLVYRERWILFPAAFAALPDEARSQAAGAADAQGATGAAGALLRTSTGALNASELKAIFSALPVDISFVGADDRLKFFSDPPGRIFPRSPASIGRLVRDCHPPKSLDKVMQIIESFKKGERNEAEFWLKARGSFVHIRYAAIRDEKGTYLGTLETSQDIGRLRTLEGEKRLL